MQKNRDDISQTRNSHQQIPKRLFIWLKVKKLLCPCFSNQQQQQNIIQIQRKDINSFLKNQMQNPYSSYKQKDTLQLCDDLHIKRRQVSQRRTSVQIKSNKSNINYLQEDKLSHYNEKSHRQTIGISLGYHNQIKNIQQIQYPICNIIQNQLIPIGHKLNKLLIKVTKINININLSLLKKDITINRTSKQEIQQFSSYQFNRFWNQRYILFQKFDQGIKIDQNSWSKIPPQPIMQYVASKCQGAKYILDGFSGIGAASIKFAALNSCTKVIANDIKKQKISFLKHNAKIYEVQQNLQVNYNDFLKISIKDIDVVYVQPPVTKLQRIGRKYFNNVDFQPSLDKIIKKSMSLASNIIMLLPPQMNIQALCQTISKLGEQNNIFKNSCSIKIQKIYCRLQLKYILVLIGKIVQTDIKLNNQLDFIYKKLKKDNQPGFKFKKIIKKIRQQKGMFYLWNLLNQSQQIKEKRQKNKDSQSNYLEDIFFSLLIQKGIFSIQKLQKYKMEQYQQFQRQQSLMNSLPISQFSYRMSPPVEQQKMQQTDIPQLRQAQNTISQYSYQSYYSNFSQLSKRKQSCDKNSGIIIINRSDTINQSRESHNLQKIENQYKDRYDTNDTNSLNSQKLNPITKQL